MILHARTEVIRHVKLFSSEKELLIPNQEIEPGVFIANT